MRERVDDSPPRVRRPPRSLGGQGACPYNFRHDLTFDHVIPRSKGGMTWDNVVAVCSPCNLRKGGRNPREARIWPAQLPCQPSVAHLHNNGRAFPPNYLYGCWLDYLHWDRELEP